MTHLTLARQIAQQAFSNKTDKAGRPYMEHLEAVTAMVESDEDEVRAIAMLHDLLEDSPDWDVERIIFTFNARIANALAYLTRCEDVYADYIGAIKNNRDAVLVKLADLRHNMDISRLPELGDYEIKRLKKYHAAYLELMSSKNKS